MIKFHISFSILCLLYAYGCIWVFKKQLLRFINRKKGRQTRRILNKNIFKNIIFFIPIINILMCAVLTWMCFCSDEKAEEMKEKDKED